MPDVSAILGRAVGSVEPPKQLPIGRYVFSYSDWESAPISKKGNEQLFVKVRPVAALEVDQEQLAGVTLSEVPEMRIYFTLTESALFRLKNFLGHCGGNVDEGSDTPLLTMLDELKGSNFGGSVTHQSSNRPGDETTSYARISETFPIT